MALDTEGYARYALTTCGLALGAFIGAWKIPPPAGSKMSLWSTALLVVSGAFLCATFVLTVLALFHYQKNHKAERKKVAEKDHERQEEGLRLEKERLKAVDNRIKARLFLPPWERFLPVAADLRHFLHRVSNASAPIGGQPWPDFEGSATWQEALAVKLAAARKLAADLFSAHRDDAILQLHKIEEGAADGTSMRLHGLAFDFGRWLEGMTAHYLNEKRAAGIE